MPDGHRRPPFGCVLTATDDGTLVGVGDLPAAATRPAVRARRCHDIGACLPPDYGDRLTRDAPPARHPLRLRGAWSGPPRLREGRADELGGELASGRARVGTEEGPPVAARAVTRTIAEVDRLLVLAQVRVAGGGGAGLEPPPGGFVISALELDAAMRLLGGPHRRQLALAIAVLAVGGLLLVAGVVAGLANLIAAG